MLCKKLYILSIMFTSQALFSFSDVKVALISLPVTGTHLVHKCIELLLAPLGGWKPPKPKMGGQHLTGTKENMDYFLKDNYKIIFMIRDPRDRAVSYAHKIKILNPKLKTPLDKLILDVITKYGTVNFNYLVKTPFYKNMGDFSEYYKLYYPWFEYPDLLFVYFEKLIGPKAGGSRELQLAEIQKIVDFLDIQISPKYIEHVANSLWGGTFSFRDPKIGRWKNVFKPRHKDAFKKTGMGQFLIDFGYETNLNW